MRQPCRVLLLGAVLVALVGPRTAAGQLGFSWSLPNPAVGELVLFQVTGASGIQSATWDFGGPGCGSYTQVTTCTPQFSSCLSQTFRYASAGEKTVSLTVVSGGSTLGPTTHTLRVRDEGSCGDVCSWTLAPPSIAFDAAGGAASVVVGASAVNCYWNATSSAPWLHLTGATSGVGDALVTLLVDPNPGAGRSDTIAISGATVLVEQGAAPLGGPVVAVTAPNTATDTGFAVAVDRAGNRLVAWTQVRGAGGVAGGTASTAAVPGLFLRRFGPSDTPVGDTVEVTPAGSDADRHPTASFDDSGRFVVAWETRGVWEIQARLFNADGSPRGDPFRVSLLGGQVPDAPSVANGRSGQATTAWRRGRGLYLRSFGPDGSFAGDETRLDAASGHDLSAPSVACEAAARCLVAWHDLTGPTGEGGGTVWVRPFDRTGSPTGPARLVAGDTEVSALTPSVGVDALGTAVVVWSQSSADTDGWDLVARRFGPGGRPLGEPFRVNTNTAGDQLRPAVAVNAAGDFAVVWEQQPESGPTPQLGTRVAGRLFGAGGRPLSVDFEVAAPDEELTPVEPAVALSDDLAVTVGYALVNREGAGQGVSYRTFRPSAVPGRGAFLPGVAHLPGYNQTQWRTDAEVCNRGRETVDYQLAFLAADQANTFPPTLAFQLEPERCRRHQDLVLADFELDSASGALHVLSSPTGVLLSARTYNTAPEGTYGSFAVASAAGDAVVHGQETTFIHLTESADLSAGFRTNLGLLNVTQTPVTVEADLRRSDGTLLGRRSYPLLPGEYRQVNRVFREVTGGEVSDGSATLRTTTPGGAFLAVASLVDNLTGDGVSIPPLAAGGPESVWYLTGMAHLPGYNDTQWRSSLEVCNAADVVRTYELAFLEERQENLTPLVASFVVGPGRCTRHDDVVQSAFGLDQASGAIRLTSSGPDLLAVARTSNDTPLGTYGAVSRAHPSSDAVGFDDRGLLMQLSHSADLSLGSRTNLLLLNLTPLEADLQVELYRADGTPLGTLTGSLRAFEHRQLNRVFASVTAGDVDDGYAVVSTSTPQASILASASVVDNRSGDGVTVPVIRLP